MVLLVLNTDFKIQTGILYTQCTPDVPCPTCSGTDVISDIFRTMDMAVRIPPTPLEMMLPDQHLSSFTFTSFFGVFNILCQ
jgi:hypothetical protein